MLSVPLAFCCSFSEVSMCNFLCFFEPVSASDLLTRIFGLKVSVLVNLIFITSQLDS